MDYTTIIWLVAMIAIFYFLLIRPQKKKEKADRMLRNNLKPGDKITTIGGLTGRVLSVKDGEVVFETGADRTKLTIKKWAVQTKESPADAEEETKEDTKENTKNEKPDQ
ncbi:MAG: preprotein translocase subunit YajC [Clostridiaceae bacterium]|nr:preprotein translocase subunit YajC [Clostridiaceae bacterium]